MLKILLLQPRFQPGSTPPVSAPDTPSEAYHSSQFDHFSSREVDYHRLCVPVTFLVKMAPRSTRNASAAPAGTGTASTTRSVIHATLGETSSSDDQREVNTQIHAQLGLSSATPGTVAAESSTASTNARTAGLQLVDIEALEMEARLRAIDALNAKSAAEFKQAIAAEAMAERFNSTGVIGSAAPNDHTEL